MKIENNEYEMVYIDLTMRCNANCSWCCNKKVIQPDITLEHFEEICKTLPNKVEIRLFGGDPTVRDDLFDIVKIAKKYHPMVTMGTNGIALTDIEYCKKIKESGLGVVSISMDAEVDRELQILAIKNLRDVGIKRCCISTTVTDDSINNIRWFKELKEEFPIIKYMHFRTIYNDEKRALTHEELTKAVVEHFPEWNTPTRVVRDGITHNGKECCGKCALKWVNPNLQILIIDTGRAEYCHLRGYVDNDAMELNSFFAEVKKRM